MSPRTATRLFRAEIPARPGTGDYRPLLELATNLLRRGEFSAALPLLCRAHHALRTITDGPPSPSYDGSKILALWGECLYRLGQSAQALQRWLEALDLVPDGDTFARLTRTIERAGAVHEYGIVLKEGCTRGVPGALALWQRWQGQTITLTQDGADPKGLPAFPRSGPFPAHPGVAVMADVANLDLSCGEQYGWEVCLDYGRLLREAGRHGVLRARVAFVPNLVETLAVRQRLLQAGFTLDLKQPKMSHGRLTANADTAMAAAAVRWASDAHIGRVELWTGDGDFIKVREVIQESWPHVSVVFRSLAQGTAAAIRHLAADWMAIGPEYLLPLEGGITAYPPFSLPVAVDLRHRRRP